MAEKRVQKTFFDWRRWLHALVAVCAGNAIYFLWVNPAMPPNLRHKLYKLDFGVVVDFWICLCLWGLIETVRRRLRKQ